jgi:uncharacterized protein YodC (DUF2158 family)
MDIKPGDVVQLKSGGPLMTVLAVNNGEAFCSWFDSKSEAKQGGYPLIALMKDQDQPE